MTNFNPLYSATHQISDGIITVATAFTGNTLFVEVDFNTLLDRSDIDLGILYVYLGDVSTAYRLNLKQTIISLPVSSISKIRFLPTLDIYSDYSLTLKYATVGSVIDNPNAYPLPEQITGLPNRVDVLEGIAITHSSRLDTLEESQGNASSIEWVNVQNKPLTFPPSPHTHNIDAIMGLVSTLEDISSDVIDTSSALTSLTNRVVTLESAPIPTSTNFLLLTANTTLESNKSYYATVNNLVCALPSNPSIADYVELVNGNFSSFRVNHGNASQAILNNATQTTIGADSGIILKPYASIKLVFVGSNLWVNTSKYRTVNNWLTMSGLEPTASQKNYTPTELQAYTYFSGYGLNRINDGDLGGGVMKTSPTNDFGVICTLNSPLMLTSFYTGGGQFNGGFNYPTGIEIYRGNTVEASNLIYSTSNFNSIDYQTVNVSNTNLSSQYLFLYKSNNPNISIIELRLFGRSSSGGEISVI